MKILIIKSKGQPVRLLKDEHIEKINQVDESIEVVATFDEKEIAQILAGTLQEPKDDFKEVGESLETPHKCPKCGYAW